MEREIKGSTPNVNKSKEMISSKGIPTGNQDSNKNVKITFVGDHALMMNH